MSERENIGEKDVWGAVRRIATTVSGLELRMTEMARFETVKSAFDKIQSSLDGFTKEILASRSQRTLQDESFKDINERLGKHELRLTQLEKFGSKS
jgi:hypothetical protein